MKENNDKIILIIDDNPMNLLLTSKILEGFGYQTRTAESGMEGIAQVEKEIPSLILLDISMPVMDGYEVCEEIKKNEKWIEIPIIFLTANTLTEDLVKGFEKGGVDYITKPFRSEELSVRVRTHLELFESRNEILKMNRQRDKLYSIIAHDIRSPLSGILQTIDAIDQGYFDPTTEDFKEIIHHLKERTKETSTLLTSLLQWSRAKSDKFEMHPSETNVYVVVSSCLQLLDANASSKNINIHFDSDENAVAWCDEVSIHTVIRNLISNAIKFTNSNGSIWIRTKRTDSNLRIEIIDSGVGMSDETIKKIFEQNEHYTSAGTNNEQGTGLGLMLVKEFVEKNNGKILVDSVLGHGSTFVIELPIPKNS
jgi:two-component system sensor histidine kinase/response regulator